MSCRTTAAGSLATTYATRAYNLHDAQCTSLFHSLRREYAERMASQDDGERATGVLLSQPELYQSYLAQLETVIRVDSRWDGGSLRDRALQRVAGARANVPTDPAIIYAFTSLDRSADVASAIFTSMHQATANRLNVPVAAVKDEFNRLYNSFSAAAENPQHTMFDTEIPGLPTDRATRYALGVMARSAQCATCGRFLGATAHICPEPQDRPLAARPEPTSSPEPSHVFSERLIQAINALEDDEDEESSEARDFVNGCNVCGYDMCEHTTSGLIATNPPSLSDPVPPPSWAGHVNPIDMDTFQEDYDAARARIESGNTAIPTLDYSTAGAVTGGLGLRETGNSFGIEIELDFPDEDYPYEMRYYLARRLFEAGVTENPYVNGWHNIGDGDRPGGNYYESPNSWNCEFDRSVDDCDGERGVEIKSQILYDEPATWENLRKLCEIANEMGAQATVRTGLHVNVGGRAFDSEDPSTHTALLRLAGAYDDTLIRLAHNPQSAQNHRGRAYCNFANVPATGFQSVADARAYSNHYQAFNLGHLPASGERMRNSSRVEVRLWDSTTDFGRIQAAVGISLAMAHLASEKQSPGQGFEPAGTHRERFGTAKLQGEPWEKSTEAFRRFMALMEKAGLNSPAHRAAITQMFAESRWQTR